ncbi:hypothetical protein [Bradyrhizobium sp. ORS 375]|uniref:hypothetical protein n=1 Tax=Bradyrhizobium sp. (strain ORS 375) TaxID=566679 RepID=UPI0011128D53|nr:hypothetical protein [Bradyrhizobium sp. ORS 375]
MSALSLHGTRPFAPEFRAFLDGLARAVSQPLAARVERIANACDVAGLLDARRLRAHAAQRLFRVARREGRRPRRGGVFGCFRYLSELS